MTPSFKLGGIFFPLVQRTSLPLTIEFAWKFTPVLPLFNFFCPSYSCLHGRVSPSVRKCKAWFNMQSKDLMCSKVYVYSNNFHKRIKIWIFLLISQGQYYIFLNFLKRSINPMNSLQSLVLLNEILQINL